VPLAKGRADQLTKEQAMAKPAKIELPADLTKQYAPPAEATLAELQEMQTQVRADADKLLADDNPATADERIGKANWLIGALESLQGRQDEIVKNDEAAKERLAEARSRLSKGDDAGAEAAAAEADASKSPDDADAEVQAQAAAAAEAEGGQPLGGPGGTSVAPAEPVLVASAGVAARRSAIAAAVAGGGQAPVAAAPGKPREAYLTAAAEVPGYQGGQKIDMRGLGDVAEKRFSALPQVIDGQAPGGRVQLGLGAVHVPSDPGLVASAKGGARHIDLDEAIEWALSSERLKAETGEDSLLAAGGWCAPSETLYDLVNLTTRDGLLDVPGITVSRGGVRYSLGPDFTAVYNAGANFTRTEAQTIAGTPTKPMVNIPCPTFTDNRMVVDGLYLTGDILSSRGYPEAYADFTEKALTAFAHYVNAATVADIETLSGTVIDLTVSTASVQQPNLSISTEVLGAVELQITDMRYKNRLGLGQTVNVIFPLWLKGAIRSDLAKRQGVEDASNLPDSEIDTFFNQRGARVQWVYDWQDAFTGVTGGFGSAGAAVAWPTTAKFLIHPEGAFVRALSDVIELNAVYDAQLLQTNQYVALFLEQARLTLKRAHDVRVCKIPVAVTGATGAAIDYTVAGRQPTV
jgi:hypothetical protein